MKKKFWFILGALVIVLLASIFFVSRNSEKVSSQTIKIGYVDPLTGDAATYGEPMKNAASMAVEDINNQGGINGKKLDVIYEDSQCTDKGALTAVQKLVFIDGVKILDGFTCAGDILATAPVIQQNKILALAPGASGPQVSLAGDYIFQTDPSATQATNLLAQLISKSYRTVAIVSEESQFATDIRDYFTKQFESLGGEVVSSETYAPTTTDFRTLLTKIKATNPSAIFVNPQTEATGGLFIKQAREMGITVQLFGLDTLSGPTTREISGKASEGLTLVVVPDLDPKNETAQAFLAEYKEKFGEPPFALYLASAYDSINIIAQAIKNVGEDPTKMKDYLYQMPDYHGAVGTYHFDQNGDIVGINFGVKKVVNGNLVDVQG